MYIGLHFQSATLRDLLLILNNHMFVSCAVIGSSKFGKNSPIEDSVKAVGLQVNVRSPIAKLVLGGGEGACCENIFTWVNMYTTPGIANLVLTGGKDINWTTA